MDGGETLVTVEFRDQRGETEVILTHERFRNAEERDRHQQGWSGCLERLETFCSKLLASQAGKRR